eukprot:scaffold27_cov182-Ochromonas_danica.AAC.1
MEEELEERIFNMVSQYCYLDEVVVRMPGNRKPGFSEQQFIVHCTMGLSHRSFFRPSSHDDHHHHLISFITMTA